MTEKKTATAKQAEPEAQAPEIPQLSAQEAQVCMKAIMQMKVARMDPDFMLGNMALQKLQAMAQG